VHLTNRVKCHVGYFEIIEDLYMRSLRLNISFFTFALTVIFSTHVSLGNGQPHFDEWGSSISFQSSSQPIVAAAKYAGHYAYCDARNGSVVITDIKSGD